MNNRVLILLGPTAVGKSKVAVELAKALNGEIISADSMQVYKGMDIGTAKPTLAEREGIPHHLVDIVAPDEEFNVSKFIELANEKIKEIHDRGKLSIIVGGTGMYLFALLKGFSLPIIKADPALRERLHKEAEVNGTEHLYQRLTKIDPIAASKIHPHDLKRTIRALEVYELTGMPISKLQRKQPEEIGKDAITLGLNMERKKLYQQIEERINEMLSRGLVAEVKGLREKGYGRNFVSMQALGYKEGIDYLDGKYDYEEMVRVLKQRTRNFAKRQMTWFRRFEGVKWFAIDDNFETANILSYLEDPRLSFATAST